MRIDKYLAETFGSRTKAAQAIEKGLVLVNGRTVAVSYEYREGDNIQHITPDEQFVSNGGYKLSKALKEFNLSVEGKIFADIGASNGGFTDCLFQNGAEKVYCIDVGESQLDKSLLTRNVVVMDNFNARNLSKSCFDERLDGAVIDVSFISLTYVLPNVAGILDDGATVVALIKPQFECENKNVGKRGIVKSSETHKYVITKIYNFAKSLNLITEDFTTAPIKQGKNIEYLVLLRKNGCKIKTLKEIFKYVKL